MEKLKLHWGVEVRDTVIGNGYGYRKHNEWLKAAVSKLVTFTPDAKDVLTIISPEFFKRIEGKRNWLFTMFEAKEIPEKYQKTIRTADVLIAPSNWVADVLRAHFPQEIYVVPHGVLPDYSYMRREYPKDKPFRFLWMGAPNPRKGWEEVIHTWERTEFSKRKDVELYLKTTRVEGVEQRGNVILDGRNLPDSDVVALYHSAHCFLFPTRGEGFGLTLAEALATGLPSIATGYSGLTQFFDDRVGYTLKYEIREGLATFVGDSNKEIIGICYPDAADLYLKMHLVLKDYKNALIKGKRGSDRMKANFTWEKSAQTLVKLIQEHGG